MEYTDNYGLPQYTSDADQIHKEIINKAYRDIDQAISDLQETVNTANGGGLTTIQEVVEARKGKSKLVDEINSLESKDADLQLQIDNGKKLLKVTRTTDGYKDSGTVATFIANEGHSEVGSAPYAQVCGFTSTASTSTYADRDSVCAYVSNRSRNATVSVSSGTITYGSNYVQVSGITVDLSGVKAGMLIDTKHTPNRWTSIVDSVDTVNKKITVKDGWYKVQTGGSTTPSTPPNGTGFDVNMVTKIWGVNNNVFLYSENPTASGVAEEIGLFNTKSDDSLSGIDIVNFWTKKAGFGMQIRGASGGTAVGFTHGLKVYDTDYVIRVFSDTPDDYVVYSTKEDGTFDSSSFYMTNSGKMSKLALSQQNITSASTAMSSSCSIFYMSFAGTFNLPSPSVRAGHIMYIRNNGGSNITLDSPSGNIYDRYGGHSTYLLRPNSAITLTSDGSNYIILSSELAIYKGTSAPTSNAEYIGQDYVDTTNRKCYKAVAVGTGASDWVALN